MLSMAKLLPNDFRRTHFKNIEFSKLPSIHQTLLLENGFENITSSQIKISNLITIKNTCNNFSI